MGTIETEKKVLSCALTGPRFRYTSNPSRERYVFTLSTWAESTLKTLIRKQYKKGLRRFYCGCAFGADLAAGELVVKMRQKLPELELYCVLPYANQAARWERQYQDQYQALLDQADQVILLREKFVRGCYHARNRYMVNHSDLLIAVEYSDDHYSDDPFPKTPKVSGTEYTVRYALAQHIPVIALYSGTQTMTLMQE